MKDTPVSAEALILDLKKLRDDIQSGRKGAETLSEKLDILRSLVEDSNEVFYVSDHEGRLLYVSPQIERYRIGRREVFEKGVTVFIDPEDRERVWKDFHRTMKTGEEFPTEFRIAGADGRVRWLEDYGTTLRGEGGRILGLMGSLRDVTDRKTGEKALRDSEARYRAVVEGQTELICRIDPDHRITFVNDAFCRYFDRKRVEVLGRDFMSFVAPEDGLRLRRYLESLGPGNRTGSIEHRVVTPRGPRWQLWTSSLIHDEGGRLVEMQFVGRDITKRKEAEEKSRRIQKQLLNAQKMEAVGTLAGGIAHDFNNLLMGILGNLSVLLLETPEDHPSYDVLKNIQDCVESGTSLTQKLLGFARSERHDVRPLCVNDFAEHCLSLFGRSHEKVKVLLRLHDDPAVIEVDRVQMEQAVLNLLFNGLQAMPGGGELALSTGTVVLKEEKAAALGLKPGPHALIAVSDTGVGMDEQTRERIFEPFFTTKEIGRGTGLGLSSAYGIVRSHGGAIEVSSLPGEGSRFAVYLPVSAKPAERGWQGGEEIVMGEGETVLVVDDEESVLSATRYMLEKLGYRVLTAGGTAEAVDLYGSRGGAVDVVILDVVMPEGGGEKVFNALVEMNPGVRIILTSGYRVNHGWSGIMERRGSVFLQKPFTLEQLSRKVRDALDGP